MRASAHRLGITRRVWTPCSAPMKSGHHNRASNVSQTIPSSVSQTIAHVNRNSDSTSVGRIKLGSHLGVRSLWMRRRSERAGNVGLRLPRPKRRLPRTKRDIASRAPRKGQGARLIGVAAQRRASQIRDLAGQIPAATCSASLPRHMAPTSTRLTPGQISYSTAGRATIPSRRSRPMRCRVLGPGVQQGC